MVMHKTIFTRYQNWLKENCRGTYSNITLLAYLKTVEKFLFYLENNKIVRLNDIELDKLHHFVKVKNKQQNKLYATGTQKVRMAALNLFFTWAYEYKYCRFNPVLTFKIDTLQKQFYEKRNKLDQKEEVSILTQHEMHLLLKTTVDNNNFIDIRNAAIVALILASGLYAHEITTLPINAVNTRKNELTLIDEAGNNRIIPLDTIIYLHPCQEWLAIRKNFLQKNEHHLFFFTKDLLPISQRNLHKIISQQLEQAGIRKGQKGGDILRQTAVVAKLAQGSSVEETMLMTETKSMSTMERYLNLVNEYLHIK